MSGVRTFAWLVAVVIGALTVAVVALDVGTGRIAVGWTDGAYVFAALSSAAVGLVLALRRPANPIGWVLLANAVLLLLSGFAEAYADHALDGDGSPEGLRLAAAWVTWGWPTIFAPLVALALIFPDGRLPSPRWRPVAVGGAASFVVVIVTGMLWEEPFDAQYESVEPYAVLSPAVAEPLHALGLLGMIVTLALAAAALVARFRAAEGVVRLQLKWIAYAGALIPVAILAGTVEGVVLDRDPGLLTELPFALLHIAIPIAVGISVLRYRLYDIDRLISATLVYGALTALLAAGFAAVSLGLGLALGGGSALPTAVATLAVAAAFRPLRARVQSLVDRRFNRARYEALSLVDRFLEDLRLGRAEPERIGAVLAEATADPSLELFFWLPRDEAHADGAGRLVPELPTTPSGRTPIRRATLHLGTLVHAPDPQRARLLDMLIDRAGLAIEIARLRVEVRRQLADVQESRTRIVTATYEERRRLERDLHDGAQQRLVAIGLELRHLQHELGSGAAAGTRAALDSAVTGLTGAITELRELAHGVRPAALERGLAPALRELAARTPVPIAVETTDERFEREIESAAYFVASEALTNAVKHADGSRVVVSMSRNDGRLILSVSDDGCGGAVVTPGSGLAGLSDRVAALGGRVDVRSTTDAGTTIVAELPCGS
jgi:signal transduction histidine kinase